MEMNYLRMAIRKRGSQFKPNKQKLKIYIQIQNVLEIIVKLYSH